MIAHYRRSPAGQPLNGAADGAKHTAFAPLTYKTMFNFSANHLSLISRTEYRSCVVFIMKDHHTQRVYRLYDFNKSLQIAYNSMYCVAGKVNSADKIYLVMETVKLDTKHTWSSKVPTPPERAGGSNM